MTITDTPAERLMLVDGHDVEALDGNRFSRTSPAHDVVVSSYPEADAADVERAVAAARRAFDEGPWPRMAGVERARVLHRVGVDQRRAQRPAGPHLPEAGHSVPAARQDQSPVGTDGGTPDQILED